MPDVELVETSEANYVYIDGTLRYQTLKPRGFRGNNFKALLMSVSAGDIESRYLDLEFLIWAGFEKEMPEDLDDIDAAEDKWSEDGLSLPRED